MNQHTEGVAKFKSMPDESFRFRVEQQQEAQDASHWKIWLENKSSKKQWRAAECDVKNIADFAPEGITIPLETVLGYVASCLKSTTAGSSANVNCEADLVATPKTSGELTLQVTFRFEISGFSWSPTYRFPMKEVAVEEIDILRSQLQDQREELEQLKTRMADVETRKSGYRY
ncbi:hypothetical protein Gpo141_00012926 [Globisporangium polare]